MRSRRLLLLPLFAGLAVSLAGALTMTTSSSAVTAPPPTLPLRADGAAVQALVGALERLSPEHVRWLQVRLWQKVDALPLAFQAEGLYQAGPDHRLRLDLRLHSAAPTIRLIMVSDGQTLWQAHDMPGSAATVTRLELRKVLEAIERPDAAATRADFYENQFFAGPVPLLRSIQELVTFTRLDRTRWRDHEVLLLTGARTWAPDGSCPMHLARQCRLFLDAQSLWPYRIEWWGPTPKQTGDVLLSQIEFRDPVLNRPASDALFTFQPGQVPVTDITERWTPPPALQE
jgi:hypothetical protein